MIRQGDRSFIEQFYVSFLDHGGDFDSYLYKMGEIRKWCKENIPSDDYIIDDYILDKRIGSKKSLGLTLFIYTEESAMAYKLQWE